MPARDFFRAGDKVTVHNYCHNGKETGLPGRVICTNRISPFGLCLIVLVLVEGVERPEGFTINGRRYTNRELTTKDGCYLTLGHPK